MYHRRWHLPPSASNELRRVGGIMRFTDARRVAAPIDHVWTALHDPTVLQRVIPGCRKLEATDADRYSATLAVSVGRLADTYRGAFSIEDHRDGSELTVRVDGKGRCGRLEVELRVRLVENTPLGSTTLEYDAYATVGGLVSRLGRAPLAVAASHIASCFFRELDRVVRRQPSSYRLVGVRSAS
jgi:carbon monoxide dehydrogenase subunit G